MNRWPWLNNAAVFAPENEGGGGAPSDPASVLFPNDSIKGADTAPAGDGDDTIKAGDGEDTAKAGEGDDTVKAGEGDAKPEWKDYVPDPAKTDEENAAAKAEHDKTKPADEFTVPEKYELSMPDGVELDGELLEAMTPVLKDLYITNDQAQALIAPFAKIMQDRATAQAKQWGETVDGWAEAARTEHGEKYAVVSAQAQRVINAFGDADLKKYLNESGAGNHPALVRFAAKVGAAIGEDVPDPSNAEGSGKPADPASILYPNDAKKG